MPTRQTINHYKYDAANTRRFVLKLNLKTDADIIAVVEAQESMQGFIKQAIREKIERERR